ncbi:hypothetical protein ACE38W_00115 [Chitinophaga sp. Hz27]|uniref:hypothetical protein n=1 Tax=Chitinophaga sp. Hz27 TaxID=3347169 RepID=UPI0035D78636
MPFPIKLTGITIRILELFFDTTSLRQLENELSALPTPSVGFAVHQMLYENDYHLIPRFEDHDLKHLILDYQYTMQDEIIMQAYLIGNGNYSWPCLLFFCLAIFYPSTWKYLAAAFKQGKKAMPIKQLRLRHCMTQPLSAIRATYGRYSKRS